MTLHFLTASCLSASFYLPFTQSAAQGNAATSWHCSKCWRDVQKTTKVSAVMAGSSQQCESATDEAVKTSAPNLPAVIVMDEPMPDVASSALEIVKEETKVAQAKVDAAGKDAVVFARPDCPSATVDKTDGTPSSGNLPAKKKKKKKGYKEMMASMMNTSSTRDVHEETDEAIRKVTGGGAFTKIDKI
jgi:hypothetical protein